MLRTSQSTPNKARPIIPMIPVTTITPTPTTNVPDGVASATSAAIPMAATEKMRAIPAETSMALSIVFIQPLEGLEEGRIRILAFLEEDASWRLLLASVFALKILKYLR